ncbi:MAG: D-alanine--D-alanine ligase [Cyclobacteriaceae bacterium]|nr:D-alanine--D-alanine ligase [Cyclobacteriaceae bacterium]
MNTTRRIGLLYGGKSVEHEISIRSAHNVFQNIDKSLFTPVLIGITKTGSWHLVTDIDKDISTGAALNLNLGHTSDTFVTNDGSIGTGKLDAIFPVLHGTDGEDGSIQGLLQTVNLPFAGSGVLGSAVAMDKLLSKRLLLQAGVPTSKYLTIDASSEKPYVYQEVVTALGTPFMVKPISLGSSVGVSKVKSEQEYQQALDQTLRYDQGVLLEQYISGRELECAVLGNTNAQASYPGEIIISPRYEFYTYDAKYEDPDAVEIKIPAEIPEQVANRIKELSLASYRALNCEDFARVDLFLTPQNDIFINEINTIPGFTNSSMFPSLWSQHGISYQDLITKILDLAIERFQQRETLNRDYQENL